MARLRQLHPSNYASSRNISDDFENLVRYINSAEFGNKTIAELLAVLFNNEGEFVGPIEVRLSPANGLQYRVGSYVDGGFANPEEGWVTLTTMEALRGAPGQSIGTITQSIFSTRLDVITTAGQTFIPLALDENTDAIVYYNGLLLSDGPDYTVSHDYPSGITLETPADEGALVTTFRVIGAVGNTYRREDFIITEPASVVVFEFEAWDILNVYLNGILQRQGADADYVANSGTRTVVFSSPLQVDDIVTIMVVDNISNITIAGLMLESSFVNMQTGYIRGAMIEFEDGGISPDAVMGLPEHLEAMPSFYGGVAQPSPPADFWLNTAVVPPVLMYWGGTSYLPSSGSLSVPPYSQLDAAKLLGVNGTGTALQWGSVDLSGLIRKTEKGAANGVASLDPDGRIQSSQLPSPRNRRSVSVVQAGALADGDVRVCRAFLEKLRVIGFSGRLNAGTATAQIIVNGVATGSTFSLGIPPNETVLGSPVEIDAKTASATIGLRITAASAADNLDVALVIETLE